MFWQKRNDGFEWHKYVRTTIKLKREDRRRRIDHARSAAVEGLKGAGRAGFAAGRVAGRAGTLRGVGDTARFSSFVRLQARGFGRGEAGRARADGALRPA